MKVAVIGLGWWGKQIVTCLEPSPHLDVTHGVDMDLEAVAPFALAHDLVLLNSLEAVLAHPDVDGVILATPHSLHEQQVLACVNAGKQVFCEKPLALKKESVDRMLALCHEKGVVLGVGHERRYEPAMEHIARLLQDGTIGTLLAMEANFSHDNFKKFTGTNWRLNKADSPAGAMTALGIHLTDMFISLAGPVRTVWAQTASRSFQEPAVDVVSVLLTFESGVTATMTCLSSTPFYGRFTVFGDKAWAELTEISNVDVDDPATVVVRKDDGTRDVFEYEAINTVLANFEAWAAAVENRADYRFTDVEKAHNVEILEAITRSAHSGRPIELGRVHGA
ncbi:Gfo/Idh/MocA family oxidoreductase [Roseobacter sp. YSTF-M11]|uniref:Gfo/Idh/MocA family oxidoreductase n=1 Tax=Roseobacter insulae TaxID=2859783 RepID=A0A9X1FRN0_9RHOB|nr:Gfo/Idh/MocA family oxidoreductase [Roseobacter insulae]MBW4706368.1 Gfo/Idh/MocA family oxidoreductase [Roseobacter insulae]